MMDLRMSLGDVIERFRLANGLPSIASWARDGQGWVTLRIGRMTLTMGNEQRWHARSWGGIADSPSGTLQDAVEWLKAHGLDVRPEPERFGLIGSKTNVSEHGGISWSWRGQDVQLHYYPLAPKPWSVVWDFGEQENDFVSCSEACKWMISTKSGVWCR
jgi:hypothetical protein